MEKMNINVDTPSGPIQIDMDYCEENEVLENLKSKLSNYNFDIWSIQSDEYMNYSLELTIKGTAIQKLCNIKYLETESFEEMLHKINEADDSGMTPLHIASYEGDIYITKLLLDAGAKQKINGKTDNPIFSARKYDELATFLANSGHTLSDDYYDITPLYLAAISGHIEIVKHLLSYENEILHNTDGSWMISLASRKGYTEIIEFLKVARNL